MSDSKSADHWNILARLLGTAPADLSEEKSESPESPAAEPQDEIPCAGPATELEPLPESSAPAVAELAEMPEAAAESEPVSGSAAAARFDDLFEPLEPAPVGIAPDEFAPVELAEPAQPAPRAEVPRTPVKPKPANHWRELAATLGIEVAEPEPEPEPEPAAEVKVPEVRAVVVPPASSPVPPRTSDRRARADFRSRDEEREAERTPPREPDRESVRDRTPPRHDLRRASLFEDPNLSLDTPGVLDAIFDEAEPETADDRASVEPPRGEVREERTRREERFERPERSAPRGRGRDAIFADAPEDEDVEEAAPERSETDGPRDAEDEDKSARRRKRRRRRGVRRDPRATSEEPRDREEIEDEGSEDDEELAERRSEAPDLRERRLPVKDELPEDEAEDHLEEDDEEDDEEDSGERLRLKHKKIPTWQQAVDAIITVNMESRAKNPGGGGGAGGRGRGRRWRR